jgi:hypothetical protein
MENVAASEMELQQTTPTDDDFAELVAFRGPLEVEDFGAIRFWHGTEKTAEGHWTFSWPEYHPVVSALFQAASKPCWTDFEYQSRDPAQKLQQDDFIENASLAEIRALLTFCVRGERFCDGHWGAMIESGYLLRILKRIEVLRGET